jgi:hypothetical protein
MLMSEEQLWLGKQELSIGPSVHRDLNTYASCHHFSSRGESSSVGLLVMPGDVVRQASPHQEASPQVVMIPTWPGLAPLPTPNSVLYGLTINTVTAQSGLCRSSVTDNIHCLAPFPLYRKHRWVAVSLLTYDRRTDRALNQHLIGKPMLRELRLPKMA